MLQRTFVAGTKPCPRKYGNPHWEGSTAIVLPVSNRKFGTKWTFEDGRCCQKPPDENRVHPCARRQAPEPISGGNELDVLAMHHMGVALVTDKSPNGGIRPLGKTNTGCCGHIDVEHWRTKKQFMASLKSEGWRIIKGKWYCYPCAKMVWNKELEATDERV